MNKSLAPRGTPAQTVLAHELGLHEYLWPKLLGEGRAKWERVARLVTEAAQHEHRRNCCGTSADGRTRLGNIPFVGEHADYHRSGVRLVLVALLDAGIPSFLAER